MLIVRGIQPGVAAYFTDGRDAGRWNSTAGTLLGLEGAVGRRELRRVLEGRHPSTGGYLPEVKPARRRGGWDLAFAAPKSVSLLSEAAAAVPGRSSVADCHRKAVDAVAAHLEASLEIARIGPDRRHLAAGGMIAARFDHHSSAAGDPHLHSHVLVANLTRVEGRWSAVRPEMWMTSRAAVGALYQMDLRHRLRSGGWDLDWRIRPDGLCDLVGIDRELLRSASTQAARVRTEGRHRARRFPGTAGPRPDITTPRGAGPASWPEADEETLSRAVTTRLASRRSDFRAPDVIVALAASCPGGMPVDRAVEWAQAFCERSIPTPSPTSRPRWTCEASRQADRRLAGSLLEMDRRHRISRPAPPLDLAGALESRRVTVLSCPPGETGLISQAEALADWLAGHPGTTARIRSADPAAARRWRVLSGIEAERPGERPDLLVVDRADRLGTLDLSRIVRHAADRGTRLILVEGGTLPALTNPASHGLRDAAALMGRVTTPRAAAWEPDPHERGGDVPLVGRQAAGELLRAWRESLAWRDPPAQLVGLGLEETAELNRAARLVATGRSEGPLGPGDRVVVRRGGAHGLSSGDQGRVLETGGRGPDRWAVISWDGDGSPRSYTGAALDRLGPGWAVGPRLAGRGGRPLLVLGPAEALDPDLRLQVTLSVEMPAGGVERGLTRA